MAKGLNPKQAAFVNNLNSGMTQTAAYTKAYGVKDEAVARSKASRLVTNGNVAAAIQQAQERAAEKAQVTKDQIVAELKSMGFANMGDYIEFLDNGGAAIDWSNLTREQAAAIAEVTIDEYMDGKGDDARPVKRVKFKLHDKRSSLVEMAKLLGYTEPTKVDVTSDGQPLTVTLNLGGAAQSNVED